MATRNPRRKLRQDGTVAWQARYRDPDGRQRAKEFTKKVDAERFLATTRADMARGDWTNPADAKLPVKPDARVEPLQREDVEALLEVLPARYRALAVVGAGAGLRQGEAFGLTVPNVDFLRGREIRVRQQLKHLAPDPPYLGRTKTPSSVRTV